MPKQVITAVRCAEIFEKYWVGNLTRIVCEKQKTDSKNQIGTKLGLLSQPVPKNSSTFAPSFEREAVIFIY